MLIPQYLVLALKLSSIYTVSFNKVLSIPQNQCQPVNPACNDKNFWKTFKMCSYIYARILHAFRIHSISYNIDHRWSRIGFIYWVDMYGFTLFFEVKNTVLGSPGSSIISRTQNIYAWKNINKSSNRFSREIEELKNQFKFILTRQINSCISIAKQNRPGKNCPSLHS